jgi:hypothetical protein
VASRPRPRTARRAHERAARKLVRDREQLAALERGGSAARPIAVASAAVVEVRARALPCPQCGGEYQLLDHLAHPGGLRQVRVRCRVCGVPRDLWLRLAPDEPS